MLYHLLRSAAVVALRWYYSDIVVQGRERVPVGGPLLIVCNHPNALVDALLVGTTFRRRIRLTAKATLFEQPVLAALLSAIGVVPLRRAADERRLAHGGAPVTRNNDAFEMVRRVLLEQGAVLVFPEGISHDAPSLAPIKTGAARMAFDAAGAGAHGLRILPLGLIFEAKERPRSRVLVRIGDPLNVDAWREATDDSSPGLLTAEVDRRLRDVTLNFATEAQASTAIGMARALAALADDPAPIGRARPLLAEVEVARRVDEATTALAHASPAVAAEASAFVERMDRLERLLAARGVELADLRISPRLRHGAWFVMRESGIVALAMPVALVGRVTHWLPLRLARSLAMRSLASDPSRDQPAMRTIVLGLGLSLLWYVAQALVVGQWWGAFAAALWIAAIVAAAWTDFLFSDRIARASARARTYLALRADPAFASEAVAEADVLLREARRLETLLTQAA